LDVNGVLGWDDEAPLALLEGVAGELEEVDDGVSDSGGGSRGHKVHGYVGVTVIGVGYDEMLDLEGLDEITLVKKCRGG
jgi:hypothetical protein